MSYFDKTEHRSRSYSDWLADTGRATSCFDKTEHRSCWYCDWLADTEAPAWRRPVLRAYRASRRMALRILAGIGDASDDPLVIESRTGEAAARSGRGEGLSISRGLRDVWQGKILADRAPVQADIHYRIYDALTGDLLSFGSTNTLDVVATDVLRTQTEHPGIALHTIRTDGPAWK
ncbi:hypothetical protein [Nocardia acidivorans]|uniref:hypothetical protein n=1 Tax=Nocardia acidivorans TaxID=404580 RepID=UPI0008321F78|nr:hypothetical protein [Nocardia acidivorans]